MIKSIRKVIFTTDRIIILDNETDLKNVWMFDDQGNYLRKLAEEGEGTNQYKGLNDMSAYKEEITLLSAAKHTFLNCSTTDRRTKAIFNASIGDMMERTNEGGYVLYNEYSSTDATLNNYLVFYDKECHLIEAKMPYDFEKEGISYSWSGFLSRSDNRIWFSPPFNNTIYEVDEKKRVIPRYQFDFGKYNIPDSVESKNMRPPYVEYYGFAGEWFVKSGNLVQFEYFLNMRVCRGIYDESTGRFCDLRNVARDAFSGLFSRASVMPKNGDEFALVLRAEQVESLMDDRLVDVEALNSSYDRLGDAIKTAYDRHQPILLFFKNKNSAGMAKR